MPIKQASRTSPNFATKTENQYKENENFDLIENLSNSELIVNSNDFDFENKLD